jgi:hypothetical protein
VKAQKKMSATIADSGTVPVWLARHSCGHFLVRKEFLMKRAFRWRSGLPQNHWMRFGSATRISSSPRPGLWVWSRFCRDPHWTEILLKLPAETAATSESAIRFL